MSDLHDYEVSPGWFKYPARILYDPETGVIVDTLGHRTGAHLPGLRPAKMAFIDTFDTRAVIGVDLEKHELIFEDLPEANIEEVAASLTQQGITPEMLSQVQQIMTHQSEDIQ